MEAVCLQYKIIFTIILLETVLWQAIKSHLKILKAFSIQEFEEKKLYTSFACSPQGTT